MRCELVLLAAGQASRFGSDKRFAKLPNGETMWRASLQIYQDAGLSGHFIVGKNEAAKFRDLPEGIEIHECSNARDGMSQSLTCGLKQVTADFALVALADMPFLKAETVKRLINAAEKTAEVKAIQASYKSQVGHPRLLSSELFSAIYAIEGDQGGTAVLKKLAASEKLSLELDDPGVLSDVDVPADLLLSSN